MLLALALALPPTVDQLHQHGCIPITWPQAGHNQIRYNGAGQDACKGQTVTLVYDRADDDQTFVSFDLGAGSYTVDPALLGCGRTQVDLFTGPFQAGDNPAWRLITVNYLDGQNCTPPVQTTLETTPLTPRTSPPERTPAPPVTATPTTDDPAPTGPPATTIAPPGGGGRAPKPQPELPNTGADATPTAVAGALLVMLGTLLAGLAKIRQTTRKANQ